MVTNPIPDGYTTLTPFLVVTDGKGAIDFYTKVFGATVVNRMDYPDGRVAHAELDFGHGRLQLGDASEEYGLVAPEVGAADDAVTHSIALYCPDVDGVVARAVAAGATPRGEVQNFGTGDRFGSILDPYGQRWSIMTRVEDVTPEEVERRLAEWSEDNLS